MSPWLQAAQRDVKRAQGWFWYFNPEKRARVAALRVVEKGRQQEAGVYRKARARAVREAKGGLGGRCRLTLTNPR